MIRSRISAVGEKEYDRVVIVVNFNSGLRHYEEGQGGRRNPSAGAL